MEPQKFKAIIIGATGAVGRELVDCLLSSNHYSKITIFVRRVIKKWEDLPEAQKQILNIIKVDDLDFLSNSKEELEKKLDNIKYDVLFNVLGSREGNSRDKILNNYYMLRNQNNLDKNGFKTMNSESKIN